jgi:hypothetical protein
MLLLLSSCFLTQPCQEPCQRLYSESECGIERPGRSQDELIESCLDYCQEARQTNGEVGAYDPYELTPSNESVELENRAQEELWAACIEETACDRLTEGYCAPVW